MFVKEEEFLTKIRPHLVRRTRGGWLAIAPSEATFRIGVTAPTEKEVKEKFCFVYSRWIELSKQKTLDVPSVVA